MHQLSFVMQQQFFTNQISHDDWIGSVIHLKIGSTNSILRGPDEEDEILERRNFYSNLY